MAEYLSPKTGPWSSYRMLTVYFDSGVYPPGGQPPKFITLGYSVCRPGARTYRDAITSGVSSWDPGDPVRFWGLRLERLTAHHRATLAASPAGRGAQLYDLIAAQGGAVALRANGFHGSVEMIGDGKEVIRFMNGEDSALSLRANGIEFASDIRSEIRTTLSCASQVEWKWVPREDNIADPAIRAMHRFHLEYARRQRLELGPQRTTRLRQVLGRLRH
jgi:hypothetical protein